MVRFIYGRKTDGGSKHLSHDAILSRFGHEGDMQGKRPAEVSSENMDETKPLPFTPDPERHPTGTEQSLSDVAATTKLTWSEEVTASPLHKAATGPRLRWSEESTSTSDSPTTHQIKPITSVNTPKTWQSSQMVAARSKTNAQMNTSMHASTDPTVEVVAEDKLEKLIAALFTKRNEGTDSAIFENLKGNPMEAGFYINYLFGMNVLQIDLSKALYDTENKHHAVHLAEDINEEQLRAYMQQAAEAYAEYKNKVE